MHSRNIAEGFGVKVTIENYTDWTGAIGFCTRQGAGKIKHLETQLLWIQDSVRSKEIVIRTVGTDVNVADIGTKNLTADRIKFPLS
jgi:hypothetical protein